MTTASVRAPRATPETAAYWEGLEQGVLMIPRCHSCGNHFFYPRRHCPNCHSTTVEFVRPLGTGRVHTYSVIYAAPPGYEADVPYVLAVVKLDENVQMLTRIVGVPPESMHAIPLDAPVTLAIESRDGVVLPYFRLEGGAGA